MKIAIITYKYSKSEGISNVVAGQAEQLAKRHEVHVFARHIENHHPLIKYHKIESFEFNTNKLYFLKLFSFLKRLKQKININNYDIIHDHSGAFHDADVATFHSVHLAVVKKRIIELINIIKSKNYIFTNIIILLKIYFNINNYYLFSVSRRYKNTKLIAVSKGVADEMNKYLNYDINKIAIIYNGYDKNIFSDNSNTNKGKGKFKIAFVANRDNEKNFKTLYDVFINLDFPATLLVAGSINISNYCNKTNINYLGKRNDIFNVYKEADLLVLSSIYEPFGLVVLESMACGTPAIVSKCAGISEILKHGQDSWLINNPLDKNEIKVAISTLYKDKNKLVQLSQNAIRTANKYSNENVVYDIEKIYEQIIKEKKINASK